MQSLLFPFSVDVHTRVYRDMTAEDILRKVLVSPKFILTVDLKDTLPELPQIIQYKETDLIEGDELRLFTEQGTLSVHSSSGLKLFSGKGFSITQAGANFTMDDAGNAQVIGKHTITLNFNDASLTGEKVYLGGNNHLNASLPDKPSLF